MPWLISLTVNKFFDFEEMFITNNETMCLHYCILKFSVKKVSQALDLTEILRNFFIKKYESRKGSL